jgi:hypothetical protein
MNNTLGEMGVRTCALAWKGLGICIPPVTPSIQWLPGAFHTGVNEWLSALKPTRDPRSKPSKLPRKTRHWWWVARFLHQWHTIDPLLPFMMGPEWGRLCEANCTWGEGVGGILRDLLEARTFPEPVRCRYCSGGSLQVDTQSAAPRGNKKRPE